MLYIVTYIYIMYMYDTKVFKELIEAYVDIDIGSRYS